MMKWLYIMSFLFLYILNHEPISGQNLSWRNYTTDHGLPGNEVYDQLQDSRGYMWFVTNHGICRFNGYEFIEPVDTSTFKGSEAFLPTQDGEGNIWFTRLDGSIWKIENDTIRSWEFNQLTAQFITKYRPIIQIKVAKNKDVWIALHGRGFLRINPQGEISEISPDDDSFLFTRIDDELLYVVSYSRQNKFLQQRNFKLLMWNGSFTKLDTEIKIDYTYSNKYLNMLQFPDKTLLFNFGTNFYLLANDQIAWQGQLKFIADKMIIDHNGSILIPSHSGKFHGLIKYESIENLKNGIYKNLLPDHYVTRILEDKDGGYWATTHHAGVFYCKNPDLEIFNKYSGLSSDDIVCMSDDASKYLFLGTRPAGIIKMNTDDNSTTNIASHSELSRETNVIFYDKINDKIYADQVLHSFENNNWIAVGSQKENPDAGIGFPAKSITTTPDGKSIWISSHAGFAEINLTTGLFRRFGQNDGNTQKERTFSVAEDMNAEIWVTTSRGLRVWRNDQYEMPPFSHSLLHYQPRNILITDDGSMLFSLSGNGILIKNELNNWQHISSNEGLISNNISKFYKDPDGIIYVCSSSGLSLLSKKDGKWNINNITEKDGLPSNQVNDIIKLNGVLWIATNKGLVKLKKMPFVKAISPPVLEKLWINNEIVSIHNDLVFDHDENNITLRVYALHYRSDAKIPYRFRLSGADSVFTSTKVRDVNFANLAPGNYLFQVQAQNEAGEWSEMTQWPFVINPAWWQTVWFWLLVGCLFAAVLLIWYRERLKKKQHEFEIAIQIKDLESAALRAQMNPHFIFNSLSSIQHFIAESDKDAAISYLAKFARLVRLALHGSIDGQHSLREEIEMLENYLSLEQLRFRGKFDFSIIVSTDIEADEVALPPMLVQPFVENALLHGMKNKVDGGKIEISFKLKGEVLIATIKDNGPGIHSGNLKFESEGHKSVGMTLTKHRLEILFDNINKKSYEINDLRSDTGEVLGTSVILSIPLN